MKRFFALFLIILVAVTAGAGFFLMSDSMSHDNCLAAVSLGIDCSQIFSAVGLAGFHANFLSQFTTAVLAAGTVLVLFLLLFYFEPAGFKSPPLRLSRVSAAGTSPPLRRFTIWFARHEHSPSSSFGRA